MSSFLPAISVVAALQHLQIRSVRLGVIAGLVMALASLALVTCIEFVIFSSFEANPGILLQMIIMSFSTSVAGAYAGYLRTPSIHQ
jgi:hypothetical protein